MPETPTDDTPQDTRQPTTWLNYNGDQRQILAQGPVGPTLHGELLYPVTADYELRDQTRVGLSYIAPAAGGSS